MPGPADISVTIGELADKVGLFAAAVEAMATTRVLETGTWAIGASGYVSRDFHVPYASVFVHSHSGQGVTLSSQTPSGTTPTTGQGTVTIPAYGAGTYNLAGRALTLYGNPGDTVTVTVMATAQPPTATSGAIAPAGTTTVTGIVTPQMAATTDLYSEAAQSRLTSGNTASMNWPTTQTDAYVAVNVTAFAGGTNVTISFDQQDANGIWQSVANSGGLTAAGTKNFTVGQYGGFHAILRSGQPWRISWTTAGVFTTLTFQVAVSAR